jgi:type I restriction enzyme S subunit
MSFPRYESYKDSGVEWLGEVPEHWVCKPFWTLYRRTKRTGYVNEQLLSVYRDYGVIPKASRDDNNNKPSDDLNPYQLVKVGDLAINKMKAWQGSVAISEYQGIVSPAYFVYESTNDEISRFLHYLMRSSRYITGYLTLSKGIRVNQWDLEPQYHSRMSVVLPPKDEQQIIAAFLDRETAKIDALITEQQRLIELLKEKRQSVISHAVTKGLNPNVPMKDSGIEWLGKVPEHWEVKPIKSVASCNDDVFDEKTPHDYEIEYVEISGVDAERGISETVTMPFGDSPSRARRRVKDGDVIVSTVRTYLRAIAAVKAPPGNIVVSTGFAVVRPRSVQSRFLSYLFHAEFLIAEVIARSVGVSYPAINASELMRLDVPVPPFQEQQIIAAFLDGETTKLDTLTTEAKTAITLLQERRIAPDFRRRRR